MANETILVVDGDSRSRKILEVSFKKSGYRVLMTDSMSGALQTLEEEVPDLIVSEADLPDGDGFEFCKRVKETSDWRHIPFLFLTEEASLPKKIKGLEIGADDYLTRPIYIKEVTTRAEVLLQKRDRELLAEADLEEFEGELSEITLIDLLQTFDAEERTGVVEFRRQDRSGTMTFREGNVIGATCGKLRGAEAVYRLMLWPGGDFVVRYHDEVPGPDRIDMSTEDLLFEGIHRIEEWESVVDRMPPLDRVFETDYKRLPEFMDEAPEQVGRIARLFDGYRTLRDVIDDSPVGDVTAAKIIRGIFAEGLLEDVTPETGTEGETSAEERSHLADWIESRAAVDEETFRDEEDTSPGHPASGDPRETQEIERDDLASALSEEIESDEGREPTGFDEQEPSESGPRYQPSEDENPTFTFAAQEPEEDSPASVDETLRELEQAERMRRKEEAKRLVEQKPDVAEEGDEVQRAAAETESGDFQQGDPAEGVPRIPGATKTRNASQSGEMSPVPDNDPSETTQSGEWMQGEETEEVAEEAVPSKRNRENTPRAHPTHGEEGGAPDKESAGEGGRSRKQTREGVGDTGLDHGDDSGVPVSFETVDSEVSDEAGEGEHEGEEDVTTSAERRAVSVDEAESVKDEAAAAVRESAREALEQAETAAEDLPDAADAEQERERRGTIPFGETASAERESGLQEITPEPIETDESREASEESSGAEATEQEGAGETPGPAPESVERISTNGEVVRAEYDLTGPPEESAGGEVSADETLDGGVDDTLEGVAESDEEVEASGVAADEHSGASEESDLSWEDEPTARPLSPSDVSEADGEGSTSDAEMDQSRAPGEAFEVPSGDTEPEFEPSADEEAASEAEDPSTTFVSANDEEETDRVGADQVSDLRGDESKEDEESSEQPESSEAVDDTSETVARTPNRFGEAGTSSETTSRPVDDTAEFESDAGDDSEPEESEEGPDSDARVADHSSEVDFFEQEAESQEEYDWEFDDEVDQGGGWRWAAILVGLVGGSIVVFWAFVAGPFSSSSSESPDEAGGAVATSEEPESESKPGGGEEPSEGTSEGDEPPRTEPGPPAVETKSAARERAQATVAAIGESARETTSYLATGFGPDAGMGARGSDAGASSSQKSAATSEKPPAEESVAATTQQPSSTSSPPSGGEEEASGTSSRERIAQARSYIRNGEYSRAQSTLEKLREEGSASPTLARLFLQLGSHLQTAGRESEAREAYQDFLSLQSEGPRAKEVRHILDNEL